MLPALVRRHLFDDDGHTDFLVAVVSRDDPSRVIFESEPGAAESRTRRRTLASRCSGRAWAVPVHGARWHADGGRIELQSRARADPPPPPPPPRPAEENASSSTSSRRADGADATQRRAITGGEGHWRLVAKHRAGSLEAAVAAARTRNFVLSSGILALLATAIGLIVVSARRADRLARQQLEFVAAVSHELRTPVSVIGAAAGNLADGVVDEPGRVKKYGATIQAEARRLGETVERVLQLAGHCRRTRRRRA